MEHWNSLLSHSRNIAFIAALILLSGVFASAYTEHLQDQVDDSIVLMLDKQSIFDEQLHILQQRHMLIRDIISIDDPFEKDEFIQQHAALATRFMELRLQLKELPLSAEEIELLEHQITDTQIGYNLQSDLVDRSIAETDHEHYEELLNEVYPVTSRAYENIREYQNAMEEETHNRIIDARNNYEKGWQTIFAIYFLVAFFVCIAFILFTVKQRRLNKELHWKASHDNLTQLCNRAEFERVMSNMLDYHQRGTVNSILYIDLDEFKVVNDSCGHMAGDELLIAISGVLRENVRKHDVVARLGGDEFGVLLMGCREKEATEVAELIRDRVHNYDFIWEGNTYHVGASIGVMEIDDANCSNTEIMKRVDNVCYTAKEGGRNRVHVYSVDDEYTIRRIDEVERADDIRSALRENRFILYRQRFQSMRVELPDTAEILVRMLDKQGRVIAPGKFMPAATRFHLMPEIDRWVIEHTLDFIQSHPEDEHVYNINLSGQTLNNDECHQFIVERLKESTVDCSRICFEITEDSAITNLNKTVNLMNELHRMGCRFALDDFGTGLSSFTYLQKLPVDVLKIDGSFVKNLSEGSYEHTFIEAMCSISRTLDVEIVAEWVETTQVMEILRTMDIDFVQGHLIATAEPLPHLDADDMRKAYG